MKKLKIFLLTLLLSSHFSAFAKVYIDVTQVSDRSFPIALVPLTQNGGDAPLNPVGEQFVEIIQHDLDLMSIFRFIDRGAFLEDTKKNAYKEADINFANWAVLDALALLKGWYKVSGNKITLEAYFYDVLLKKEIVSKRYEGTLNDLPSFAHKFANRIVESLTGEPGLFETQIAFIGEKSKTKELYISDFNGDHQRKLTDHNSLVLSPQWSHDGKSVYYTAFLNGKNPQLFSYDLKRDQYTKKTNFPGMVIGLRLHPTQDLLATTLTKDGNSEIYLLTLNGEIDRRVTNHSDIDVSGSFSPDGKQIVFVSNRDGSAQIYKIDIDGSNATRLTFKGGNNTSPVWSPKGDKIAFAGMDTDGQFDIFTMNVDGQNMNRLTYDTRNNIDPAWAPDGQMLAFASNRKSNYQIFIMRPDGSHQTPLTKDPFSHLMPVWGPKPK